MPALASSPSTESSVADASVPNIVETYDYPGAARILEEKSIKLVRGDGHIVLADCDSSDKSQIKVQVTRGPDEQNKPKLFCFRATAKSGFLALEVPRVFYIETADHPVSAKLTTDMRRLRDGQRRQGRLQDRRPGARQAYDDLGRAARHRLTFGRRVGGPFSGSLCQRLRRSTPRPTRRFPAVELTAPQRGLAPRNPGASPTVSAPRPPYRGRYGSP